jgi:hypothetical protein
MMAMRHFSIWCDRSVQSCWSISKENFASCCVTIVIWSARTVMLCGRNHWRSVSKLNRPIRNGQCAAIQNLKSHWSIIVVWQLRNRLSLRRGKEEVNKERMWIQCLNSHHKPRISDRLTLSRNWANHQQSVGRRPRSYTERFATP